MLVLLFLFCVSILFIRKEMAIYKGFSLAWILILNSWTLQLKSQWNWAGNFQSYSEKKLMIEVQYVSTYVGKDWMTLSPLNEFTWPLMIHGNSSFTHLINLLSDSF